MPLFDGGPLLALRDAVEDLGEALHAVGRQLHGEVDSVNDPAQNGLASGPRTVPLAELLEGDWLSPGRSVPGVQRAEHIVNSVKKRAANSLQKWPLRKGKKIVDKNIRVLQRVGVRREREGSRSTGSATEAAEGAQALGSPAWAGATSSASLSKACGGGW